MPSHRAELWVDEAQRPRGKSGWGGPTERFPGGGGAGGGWEAGWLGEAGAGIPGAGSSGCGCLSDRCPVSVVHRVAPTPFVLCSTAWSFSQGSFWTSSPSPFTRLPEPLSSRVTAAGSLATPGGWGAGTHSECSPRGSAALWARRRPLLALLNLPGCLSADSQ